MNMTELGVVVGGDVQVVAEAQHISEVRCAIGKTYLSNLQPSHLALPLTLLMGSRQGRFPMGSPHGR